MTRSRAVTLLAGLIVLVALALPRFPLVLASFLRFPVEPLIGIALLLVLPVRARRAGAGALGALLGLLAVLGVLNAGFRLSLNRPFDPVVDAPLLGDGLNFVAGSYGAVAAVAAIVGAVLLVVGVPVLVTASVLRLSRVVERHRGPALRGVAVLTPVWVVFSLLGSQITPGIPLTASSAARLARDTAVGIPTSLIDRQVFAGELAVDAFAGSPDLLGGLRGKDVVVAFVESYGRDAVTNPEYAPQVGALLDDGTRRLDTAGFAARSGFLTSPISGGSSWLAHATFGSGLHVDDQQRHNLLADSDRLTLTSAFDDAGWDTVAVMPGTTGPWPEGEFYGYDRVLDHEALGYRGPDHGWATVPDQYTLSAFERLARGGDTPLMAEIALVTSHAPWPLTPPMLDWDSIGDGRAYRSLAPTGEGGRADYRRTIEYSLDSLVSWVETYGDDDLVVVVLGDHQPLPAITGEGATRDVPISVITRDRAVLGRTDPWGWSDGLRPAADAPVWPMESFRDRFLTTFTDPTATATAPSRASGAVTTPPS